MKNNENYVNFFFLKVDEFLKFFQKLLEIFPKIKFQSKKIKIIKSPKIQ